MGAKDSKTKSLEYDPKCWQEVEKSTFYEVMKNKSSGVLGHLYHFYIKSDKPLKDQIDIYTRRRTPGNYVQVLGANLEKSGYGFCGSQQNANVLTERIPVLLNGTSNLTEEQSNIVMFNAIKGYQETARMVVPGSITDKMIGFNEAGNTKVWVNQNFGMNYEVHHTPNTNINEKQIIGSVVSLVSTRGQLSGDYTNALRNSGSFSNALGFIQQNSRLPVNVLQANRINSARFAGREQVSSLQVTEVKPPVVSTVHVTSNPVVQTTNTRYNYTSYGLPPVVNNTTSIYKAPSINMQYGGKTETLHRVQPSHITGYAVNDVNRPSTNSYQIPTRYVETVEQPKYSFQSGNSNLRTN